MRFLRIDLALCLGLIAPAFACESTNHDKTSNDNSTQDNSKSVASQMSDEDIERLRADIISLRKWPVIEIEALGKLEHPPYRQNQIDAMVNAIVAQVEHDAPILSERKLGRKRSFKIDSAAIGGQPIVIEVKYVRPVHENIARRLPNSKLSHDVARGVAELFKTKTLIEFEVCRRKTDIVISNGQAYMVTSELQCTTNCNDPNAICEWVVVSTHPLDPSRR